MNIHTLRKIDREREKRKIVNRSKATNSRQYETLSLSAQFSLLFVIIMFLCSLNKKSLRKHKLLKQEVSVSEAEKTLTTLQAGSY